MANSATFQRLLVALQEGDRGALDELFRIAYNELRQRARWHLRDARDGASLNTTALVHEAYLKLSASSARGWDDRRHFNRVAGRAMRQILLDHARRHVAAKRGGGEAALDLDAVQAGVFRDAERLVALDQALTALQERNPRLAQVVELRFFAGLSVEETAAALEVSDRTVKRDWRLARAFLHDALGGEDQEPAGGLIGPPLPIARPAS